MENACDNRELMIRAIEEDGLKTYRTVSFYKRALCNCLVDCWELKKECQHELQYFKEKHN